MSTRNSSIGIVSARPIATVILVSLAAGMLLVCPSTASADFVGELVVIEIDSIHGHGTVMFNPHIPPHARERVMQAMQRRSVKAQGNPGVEIAVIESLTISLDGDPLVSLTFKATAGGADTTFSITTAKVTFPALTNPVGEATATFLLTDNASSPGAASIQPVSPNTSLYRAEYNDGVLFQELVGGFGFIAPDATVSNSSSYGPEVIPANVTNIQGKLAFILSAEDTVEGTARFEVVPEPATLTLLVLGGLAALRRRRR